MTVVLRESRRTFALFDSPFCDGVGPATAQLKASKVLRCYTRFGAYNDQQLANDSRPRGFKCRREPPPRQCTISSTIAVNRPRKSTPTISSFCLRFPIECSGSKRCLTSPYYPSLEVPFARIPVDKFRTTSGPPCGDGWARGRLADNVNVVQRQGSLPIRYY